MKNEKIILIDGHSILNRAFYGLPDLTAPSGQHTGAVYGFLNILFRILEEEQATHLAVAFDVHAPTFRHEKYPDYKGTRHAMPEELVEQVPLMKKVLHAMQIRTCEKAGLEADDILGTLAKRAEADGMEVSLLSGDRDLLQIASDHICVRIPKTRGGQTTIENYYAEDVLAAYQVTPLRFIDVKALMGDSSDNVPGVPKVGEKTATQLIVEYGSVQGVYDHIDEIKRPALKKNLSENYDQAMLSLDLVTIRTDCEIPLTVDETRIGNIYTEEARALFTELGFKNLLGRFEAQAPVPEKRSGWKNLTAEEGTALLKRLTGSVNSGQATDEVGKRVTIAFYPVYDAVPRGSENTQTMSAAAISVEGADPEGTVWIDCRRPEDERAIREAMRALRLAVSGQDDIDAPCAFRLAVFGLKEQLALWNVDPAAEFREGICLNGILDLQLMTYLCDPLHSDTQPEDLLSARLHETVAPLKQFLQKRSFLEVIAQEEDGAAAYFCTLADGLRRCASDLAAEICAADMWKLYTGIERPLTYILWDMQRLGLRISREALSEYSDSLLGRIGELEKAIYEEAGETFNISSPKQLGQILFEKMGIRGGKKTRTGYSTAADVLEKLAEDHPIARDVLEYRGLTKLRSTYGEGLKEYIAEDGRIHTSLNQTVTATGRISSNDPNLQNIPMKTELGRKIRKAFIPRDGWSFTDADYSQIELRILAHMSGDEELIAAYRENKDIHRITASKVFNTPFEEVTPLQRRNAKAVNFGIVYGISSFGLSQDLSISRQEAADYIRAYFETYPAIKAFLDRLVKDAKENEYAVTLYGRRRPVPELKNSNFMQRQFGERIAMNSPIQGTAADVMKIAMIRVWERLLREGLQSQMILQIHDELLIETAPGEEAAVRKILDEEMTGAADLRVRLETDIHSGADWYMAK